MQLRQHQPIRAVALTSQPSVHQRSVSVTGCCERASESETIGLTESRNECVQFVSIDEGCSRPGQGSTVISRDCPKGRRTPGAAHAFARLRLRAKAWETILVRTDGLVGMFSASQGDGVPLVDQRVRCIEAIFKCTRSGATARKSWVKLSLLQLSEDMRTCHPS